MKERKNILVITLSNIGDVILTTPVLCSLRAAFPQARLTVVVGPKAASLLEESATIDRLLIYDKKGGWSHKLELLRALREEFYEGVVDLRNSLFPFLVRANRRSPLFRFHQAKSARARHLQVLQRMKFLPSNGAAAPLFEFDFFSKGEEASLFEKLKRKGVPLSSEWGVVAPGAGSEAKRWRIKGFCEVLERLLKISRLTMVAVGDAREVGLGERLSQIDLSRVINLAGETTLRELARLIYGAKLVLTHDSAVMHLGYELHRPVVAIFGPTDHEKYGRGSPIWKVVREPCLEDLSSEKVFEACQELLKA